MIILRGTLEIEKEMSMYIWKCIPREDELRGDNCLECGEEYQLNWGYREILLV